MHLALGSQQPAKRAAVERIAPLFWTSRQLECLAIPSTVRSQPQSDEETVAGALARARLARSLAQADLGIGIESGVTPGPLQRLYAVSWAVVVDREGRIGVGGADRFALPPPIAAAVLSGQELADVTAQVFGQPVTEAGGTTALLTAETVTGLTFSQSHSCTPSLTKLAS